MLTRLVGQDLLAAGAALHRIGVDGDGIVWLTECGLMPRDSVADLIAQGRGTGLPVLAATTSGPAAAQLAELTNVVVMHRMADAAATRQLAAAAAADVGEPLPAGPASGPDQAVGPDTLGDGEFLLAVKQPRRVVRGPAWSAPGSPGRGRGAGPGDRRPGRPPVPRLPVRNPVPRTGPAAAAADAARAGAGQPGLGHGRAARGAAVNRPLRAA